MRVWLATGTTDLRRGVNGLALQVQDARGRDPLARWSRHVALLEATGTRKLSLAVTGERGGIDLSGATRLYA